MSAPAIVAASDELQSLAAQLRLAANYAGQVSVAVQSGLGLGDLAVAAMLDPVGAADFEAAALRVLVGPLGLAAVQTRIEAIGDRLVDAAKDYVHADVTLATTPLRIAWDLPGAMSGAASGAQHGGAWGAFQGFVTSEPALADAATAYVPLMSDVYGPLLPVDGTAVVDDIGADPAIHEAPRSVSQMLGNLAVLSDHRTKHAGDIDIQILAGTDAAGLPVRKVIAYLPGTDDWSVTPSPAVTDLHGDINAIAGADTAYEQGVLQALKSAGVTPADDVTLVGHSEGGIVAVNTARDATAAGMFDISHVVTAGSPIGIAARDLPKSTTVLAIENKGDDVPRLDGTSNPNRSNIATVTIDRGEPSFDAKHSLDKSYVPGTVGLQGAGNPAIESFTDSTGDLFRLDQVSTEEYSITGK